MGIGRLGFVAAIACALAFAAAAPPAWAQSKLAQSNGDPVVLPEADQAAIRRAIEGQLQAFQRDDGAAAFSYATPTIQEKFQSPEMFMEMVRGGYNAVYRPQAVQFKDIVWLHGAPAQRVLVVGPDGVPVMAVYPMTRMPDGTWRINGCFLLAYRQNDA